MGSAMNEIGRLLGSGKEAEVYEYGELALKLYRSSASKASAFREAAHLAIIERLGLPAPRVHAVGEYDGRWGLLMDRAHGESFAGQMTPAAPMPFIERMVRLHRQIHERPGGGLPSLKARLSANIQRAECLDAASRERLLLLLAALPDGDRVCHGDFHPWNIHGSSGEATIVDWLDACSGNPAADVCRTYVLMHHAAPAAAADYVAAYARTGGAEPADVLAWLPPVAAARLAEGVPDETDTLLRLAGATPATGRS
ncbi:phosphotransferase family protein [Rhizobium binxianense]